MNKLKYFGAVLIAIAGLCPSARAFTQLGEGTSGYAAHYTPTTDTYLVGTVVPGLVQGLPSGQIDRDIYMANQLLGVSGQFLGLGNATYSATGFNGPQATSGVTHTALNFSFPEGFLGPVSINLDAVGTFQYLVVAYDGPNSGVVVWNISSLTGEIRFDSYAHPDGLTGNLFGSNGGPGARYKITGFSLLNPTSVPDGGATVMLLGGALGALGMARRFLKR